MSTNQKRIAIAEACGWTCVDGSLTGRSPGNGPIERIPDYFADLNAMHEAEKRLTNEEKTDYIRLLNNGDFSFRRLAFAPADQRAEAFGLTLNLWNHGD